MANANFIFVQDELMLPYGALKRAHDEDDRSLSECSEDSGCDSETDDSNDHEDAPTCRQRFEICRQCNEEYDVLYNDKESCTRHEGYQDVDWDGDFWADHDERCHGMIDTKEMREKHPEGFLWDCCDEPGDAIGCRTSRHRPRARG